MKLLHRMLRPAGITLAALALAGCEAQSGSALGTGGGLAPGTDIGAYTCTEFAAPGSVVSTAEGGMLCRLTDPLNPLLDTCAVTNAAQAADNNAATPATVSFALSALDPALGGLVSLAVDLPGPVASGRVAAFLIDVVADVVDVSVLRNLNVTTYLNGTQQETTVGGAAATLGLLGLVGGGAPELVGFVNTQPYNRIELLVDATLLSVDLTQALQVFETCTNAVPAP